MPLFIYADCIEHNIEVIKKQTNKNIIAVVKSNAYEMKTSFMIPLLRKNKVNFFAFEKLNEYINAKKELVDTDHILIMESIKDVTKIDNQNVRISINSPMDALNIKQVTQKTIVHLRIDTGMNRLGLRNMDEFKWVMNLLKTNKHIIIEGIYTHFSSEQFEMKYFEKQEKMFEEYLKNYNFAIIHANATKSLHKKIIGNYVRVGMALYGYHQIVLPLKPAIQLLERPCSIFYPNKNKRIGYSQLYRSHKIGVLPIGYHDVDLTRINRIYFKKQTLPLLGKSCMNHTHFLANDKINYLTWLSIFPTNGIICYNDEYNWYHILTSLKSMPRTYVRRRNYDIPKICKLSRKKSNTERDGTRGNQNSCFRIVGNGRSYFFCQFKSGNTLRTRNKISEGSG